MSKHQRSPFLSLPRTTVERDSEPPEYLVPVLVTYDNLDEAASRERATILYCRGHRAADIAVTLQVPVSTVNSWLKDARYLLATELRAGREEHLLRAIESARALAAEAWTAYERDCELQREILAGKHDRLRRRITRPGRASSPPSRRHTTTLISESSSTGGASNWSRDDDPTDNSGASSASDDLLYEEYERPRFNSQAARLLTVALAAQREVARLQGLYEHMPPPPQPVDFQIHGPIPEDSAPAAAPSAPESAPDNPPDDDSDESPATEADNPTRGHAGLAAGIQPANLPGDDAQSAHDMFPLGPQTPNTP